MGISLFSSSIGDKKEMSVSGFGGGSRGLREDKVCVIDNTRNLPNPNPANYTIGDTWQWNNFLIIKIKYHDCINYEGEKVLVYENCTLAQLKKQRLIDPHFCENKNFLSPIARFEPTKKGWNMAVKFVESLK